MVAILNFSESKTRLKNSLAHPQGRYIRRSHFSVFFLFFQDLCEFVIDCTIKDIFFFVCLFLLPTITGRNEAIIVKFKKLFVLNGTFITCSGGSHH